MRQNRQTPTLQQFKQWARINAPVARAVCMAQAFAELERERVDAYIAPILERYAFTRDGFDGKWDDGSIITKTGDLYLCGDEPGLKAFYADCDDAHRANGFTGPAGHCPALVAENLLMEAQRHLLDLAIPIFGFGSDDVYGDDRKKAIDLLLGACLKAEKEAA